MTKRLEYISWIQFIGVMCVIFGHSMNDIAVPDMFKSIKLWIYIFHMPLFFLVSGYLFSYNGGYDHKGGISGTLNGKCLRLLIPYVIWNVLFIAPKVMMADYTNDQIELSPEYFGMIMLYPRNNVLGHTWFLFALFEMFLIAILFEKLREKKQLWLPVFLGLVVVNCFGIQERFLAIGDLMKNGVFFWAGLILGSVKIDAIKEWGSNRALLYTLLVLIVGGSVIWCFRKDMLINTLVVGLAVLVFLGMIQIIAGIKGGFIEFVSRNSFAIYIMHWPILMVIRLIVYQKLHFAPIPTMIIMFVGGFAIASGIAWLFKQFKSPFMKGFNKMVLGM